MQIAFLFYEGMTALGAVGPHEILCRLPGANVFGLQNRPVDVKTPPIFLTNLLLAHKPPV